MNQSSQIHLALIPDGNRRWAKERGLMPWKGHEQSAKNFRSIVEWCAKSDRVSVLTFWAFSTENWKRDPDEVKKLMDIFEQGIRRERASLKKRKIHVAHSGRTDRLSPSLKKLMEEALLDTPREKSSFTLHVALDYGGKDEIVRAINRVSAQPSQPPQPFPFTEESVRAHLDHPELPDIDLVIRTSGEHRTSNFFLWQAAYAEWIFLEKHFPDLTEKDIAVAIEDFDQRQRRIGA